MLTWFMMRQAAIARHLLWNIWFEGGDVEQRKLHYAVVRAVYGA